MTESINDYLSKDFYYFFNRTYMTIFPTVREIPQNSYFSNKKVCFTGKLTRYYRIEAMQKVVNLGGKCFNTFRKDLDILVVGVNTNMSGKMKKAIKYGVQIISEEEFIRCLSMII